MARYEPGELRSPFEQWGDDPTVAGPSFGEYGLPRGMASRIADAIMAEPDNGGAHADDGTVPQVPRRNPHLNGDGYGEGR